MYGEHGTVSSLGVKHNTEENIKIYEVQYFTVSKILIIFFVKDPSNLFKLTVKIFISNKCCTFYFLFIKES